MGQKQKEKRRSESTKVFKRNGKVALKDIVNSNVWKSCTKMALTTTAAMTRRNRRMMNIRHRGRISIAFWLNYGGEL